MGGIVVIGIEMMTSETQNWAIKVSNRHVWARWFAKYRETSVYRSFVSSRLDILFLPFCKSLEVTVAGIVI